MRKTLASLFLTAAVLAIAVSAWAQYPKYIYGTISWYGDEFRGKQTADGEQFDPDQLTAAHRTLPFGTILEVENYENGKKVTVRVNDRGPFVDTQVLDITKKAAEELGFSKTGTAYARITLVKLGDNQVVDEVRNPISNTNQIPAALASSVSSASSSAVSNTVSSGGTNAAAVSSNVSSSSAVAGTNFSGTAQSAFVSSAAASSRPFEGVVIVTNELQPLTNYSLLTNFVVVRREFVATNQVFVTNVVQVEVTNVVGLPPYTDKIVENDVTGATTNETNHYIVDMPREENLIPPVTTNNPFAEITVTNFVTMTNWVTALSNSNGIELFTNEFPAGTNGPSNALPGFNPGDTNGGVNTNGGGTNLSQATSNDLSVRSRDNGNFILAEPDNDTNYSFLQESNNVSPEVLLADETAIQAESNAIRSEAIAEATNVPVIEIPRPETNTTAPIVTNYVTNVMVQPTTNYIYSNFYIMAVSNVSTPVSAVVTNAAVRTVSNKVLPETPGNWAVQVGAFTDSGRALTLYDVLKRKGYQVFTSEVAIKGKHYIRVRLGYYPNSKDAALAAEKLKELKLSGLLIQVH
jgi:rare lipoprotein A